MSAILRPDFPKPPMSEGGPASAGAPPAVSPPAEASIHFGVGADYAGETAAAPPPRQPTPNPIQLLCKTLAQSALSPGSTRVPVSIGGDGTQAPISTDPAAPNKGVVGLGERAFKPLTKEQRFQRWLLDNPVMERNPYARQWFENAEAAYDHSQWKDYQEERDGDVYR